MADTHSSKNTGFPLRNHRGISIWSPAFSAGDALLTFSCSLNILTLTLPNAERAIRRYTQITITARTLMTEGQHKARLLPRP